MMTTSAAAASPAYGPGATGPDRSSSYASASVDASARAAFRNERRAGVAAESQVDETKARAAAQPAPEVPDVMKGLSTVAVANAMASTPAALNMMREIALASASGSLSDADRRALQDEYSQLSQQVVTTVGSVSTSEQAQTQKRDEERQEDDYRMYRETSDDRRSTLTQTAVEPVESTQQTPVTHNVTVQRSTVVSDGHAQRRDPVQSFRTQEIHVGTDSYEPTSTRQRLSQGTQPANEGHIENHAETRAVTVIEAAQVMRFVEVAHTQITPPLNAVA